MAPILNFLPQILFLRTHFTYDDIQTHFRCSDGYPSGNEDVCVSYGQRYHLLHFKEQQSIPQYSFSLSLILWKLFSCSPPSLNQQLGAEWWSTEREYLSAGADKPTEQWVCDSHLLQ